MSPVEKYWDGTQYVPILGGISQGAADARYVLKSGDTMTGPLALDLAAGSPHNVEWRTGGNLRWSLGKTADAETGSDAGSNLTLASWTDAGVYKAAPIQVNRATGAMTFTGPQTVFSPASGWVDLGGSGAGLYLTRAGSLIAVEGMLKPTSSTAVASGALIVIATIPAGWWPVHTVYSAGTSSEDDGAPHYVRIHISNADGTISFRNGTRAYTLPTSGYIGVAMTYRGN